MTISRQVVVSLLLVFCVVGCSRGIVGAETANVSQSYGSSKPIQPGSIVSLNGQSQDTIVAANQNTATKVIGVAVKRDDSLLAVNAADSKVQVATTGKASVLVSTINGAIAVGDQIAISPFDGIGVKSVAGQHVVGWAQTAFSDKSAGGVYELARDSAGKQHRVYIGYVTVAISVGLDSRTSGEGLTGLQRLVRSLTGRTVSTPRVILALVITGSTLVALVVLIYSAIYGSIISIGRNPLAKDAIIHALWYVVWMATITVVVAMALLYVVVR